MMGTRRALLGKRERKPWWYVPGQTCVAAYQPIGAASLAASYVNLANPGTYNAYEGIAPAWDDVNGWKFASTYLMTGITPVNNQLWSLFIRYSNLGTINYRAIAGCLMYSDSYYGFELYPWSTATTRGWRNGSTLTETITPASNGIIGFGGNTGYFDGVSKGIIPSAGGTFVELAIGATNNNGVIRYQNSYIQAFAIYSTTLNASDAAALTARMQAL